MESVLNAIFTCTREDGSGHRIEMGEENRKKCIGRRQKQLVLQFFLVIMNVTFT